MVPQAEGRGHHVDQAGRRVDLVELNEPCAVGELAADGRGKSKCETCFTDAADSGQCQQPGRRQQMLRFGEFVPATDETGQFQGQIPPLVAGGTCGKPLVLFRLWFHCGSHLECHVVRRKFAAALNFAQVIAHSSGRGLPVLWVAGHRLLDHRCNIVGDALIPQIRCRFVCDADELGDQLFAAAAFERGMTGQGAEQGGPESVDIRGGTRGRATEDLGRGERRRTSHYAGRSLEPAGDVRDPEVRERRLPVISEEDVRGLDVTVNDAPAVGGLQRSGQFHP